MGITELASMLRQDGHENTAEERAGRQENSGSLVERAARMAGGRRAAEQRGGHSAPASAEPESHSDGWETEPSPDFEDTEDDWEAAGETRRCYDGYVRRSPVQHYRTRAGYARDRRKKVILIAAGILLCVLLALALWRSGLLGGRFSGIRK